MPSALPFNGNQPLVDRSTNFPVFSRRFLLNPTPNRRFSFPSPLSSLPSSTPSICHVHPESRLTLLPPLLFLSSKVFKDRLQRRHTRLIFRLYIRRQAKRLCAPPPSAERRRLIVISWPGICLLGGGERRLQGASNLICSATIFSRFVFRPRDYCIRRGLLIPPPRDGDPSDCICGKIYGYLSCGRIRLISAD